MDSFPTGSRRFLAAILLTFASIDWEERMETLTREQLEKRVEATLEAEAPKQVAALAVLYLEVLTDYLGQPVVVELPGGTWTFHPTPTHVQKVGWFARIAEEGSGR